MKPQCKKTKPQNPAKAFNLNPLPEQGQFSYTSAIMGKKSRLSWQPPAKASTTDPGGRGCQVPTVWPTFLLLCSDIHVFVSRVDSPGKPKAHVFQQTRTHWPENIWVEKIFILDWALDLKKHLKVKLGNLVLLQCLSNSQHSCSAVK